MSTTTESAPTPRIALGSWLRGALRGRSDERLERWEQRSKWPLLTLALVSVPLLMMSDSDLEALPTWVGDSLLLIDLVIWSIFALDLFVRIWLAEKRVSFVRENWFDVVIVAVPYLRTLRLVMYAMRIRKLVTRQRVSNTAFLALAIVFGGTEAVLRVHQSSTPSGSGLNSWIEAFWWTLNTMVTGDGVNNENSALVNVVGAVVTLLGFALLGMVTATIAAWFVEQGQDKEQEQILAELQTVQEELRALREEVARQDRAGD